MTLTWDAGWRWDQSGLAWDGNAPAATNVTYRVLADLDRDGVFCPGVGSADPLNQLATPVWWAFDVAAYDGFGVAFERLLSTDYGMLAARFNGATGGYGLWIGAGTEGSAPVIDQIAVEADTTYTFVLYTVGVQHYGGATFMLAAWDQDENQLGAETEVAVTEQWTRTTLTFTTAADTTHVAFTVLSGTLTTAAIDVTGFMLVAGDTAPTAYNAGDSTNAYDDLTAYTIGVDFRYGFAEQPDLNVAAIFEGVADPAEMRIELSNAAFEFLPEAPASPLHGLLGPGMLVKVQAEANGTTYPQFVGRLKRIHVDPNAYGGARAFLVVQDINYELLDAEYLPELQTNVRVDEAIAPIFEDALVPWPYAKRFCLLDIDGSAELDTNARLYQDTLMDFDEAYTTLGYAGDNLDNGAGVSAQGAIRDFVAAEAGGRFFYDARRGRYAFQNRAYDADHRGVVATFDGTEFLPEPETLYTYGDGIINTLAVNYEPREAGDDVVVLWEYEGQITLRFGESRTLTVRYRDPDNPDARVGATDVFPPLYGVDYTLRNKNGTLVGVGYIGMGLRAFGDRAELTITNSSVRSYDTIVISNLRLRGRAIKAFAQQQAFANDPESIAAYEQHNSLPFYLRSIDDADFAQEVARWYVSRYSRPIARYAYVTFEATESETLLGYAFRLNVGDRITIQHDRIGHDQDYIVAGMAQQIRLGAHRVRLILTPAARTRYYILDEDGYAELDSDVCLFL